MAQNKNSNSNDESQRDAHAGTSLRGRPVDNTQYYTNNEIGNDEKRCRPVGKNQQQLIIDEGKNLKT